MIESHDLAPPVGADIYATPVDYMDYSGPTIEELLERIANYSERQREKVPPTWIELSPTISGQPIVSQYAATTRVRIVALVYSGGTAGNRFRINFGFRKFEFFFDTQTHFLEFPYQVDRGIDIFAQDLTTPNSTNWTLYIAGYTE